METEPYSIYVNNRPFKIAFLVDPNNTGEWVNEIFHFNREKWGGRFNPIIFTDGQTFKEEWWKFIRDYDPDIIYSTVTLSDELKKRIRIFLSPLRVEEPRSVEKFISLSDHPISILPSGKNVQRVSRDIFNDKSSLVYFEVDSTTPDNIKKFLDINFGLLERLASGQAYLSNFAPVRAPDGDHGTCVTARLFLM